MAGLFAEKGMSFGEEATAIIEAAKVKAANMVKSQGAIENRVAELVELGIDKKLAQQQAKADLENGKITIPDDAVITA